MPIEPDNEMTTDSQNKLKIASFRTTDGAWAEFTAAARAIGLTATDVLKAAMEQFVNGEYSPSVNTGIGTGVSTSPNISREEIQQLIDTAVSTAVSMQPRHDDMGTDMGMQMITRHDVESIVSTAISTLSIQESIDVLTARLDAIESGNSIPTPEPEPAQVIDEIPAEELGETSAPEPELAAQYTAKELAQVLKTSTQLLGKWRDAGKLEAHGYKAVQDGRGWTYHAIDTSTKSA